MSFGEILRENKGITQEELGKKLNLSKANVSKYELSKLEPNIETLSLIADYFEVSTDYLLGKSEIMNKTDLNEKNERSKQTEDIIKIDPDLFVQMCRATYLPEEDRKKIREYSAMLLEKHLRKEKAKKGNDIPK